MYKKTKIPFLIAPLIFIVQWGFFIFQNTTFESIEITAFTVLLSLLIYLLEKNYPVISDNYQSSIFVFFTTTIPIFNSLSQPLIIATFISLFFLLLLIHKSLNITGFLGIITGIATLLNFYLGLFLSIIPIIFIITFTPEQRKIKTFIIFILTILEIFVLYYLSRYIWEIQINKYEFAKYNDINVFLVFIGFYLLIAFLSLKDYFKFSINKRKHLTVLNIVIILSLIFFYITKNAIFLGIIPFLWTLLSYLIEKKTTQDLWVRIFAIIFSISNFLILYLKN
jgi:hypothetical protein